MCIPALHLKMAEQQKEAMDLSGGEFGASNLANHKERISQLCRICGNNVFQPILKTNFTEELNTLFNVVVQDEDSFIFPTSICNSHVGVLYRFRSARKTGVKFSTSMTLSDFTPHSDSKCRYCLSKPEITVQKKKKKTVPGLGRGKRSKLCIDPEPVHNQKDKANPLLHAYTEAPAAEKESLLDDFISGLQAEIQLRIIKLIVKNSSQDITADIEFIQKKYDNISKLKAINVAEYLKERNKIVMTLLGAMTISSPDKDYFRLSVLLESVYKLRNSRFLGPVSMLQNLTVYSMTNSKTAVDIIGNSGAGGKYSTICRWLSSISSVPVIAPKGDTLFIFDNEQMIGKTWNIRPQNKVKSSVITTVSVAQLESECSVESDTSCHPKTWFTQDRAEDMVTRILTHDNEAHNEFHQIHMDQFKMFIRASIEQILEEQESSGSVDFIDRTVSKLQQIRDFKTCPQCDMILPKTKRKCPTCKIGLVKFNHSETGEKSDKDAENDDEVSVTNISLERKSDSCSTDSMQYDHIPSNHPSEPIPVYVLDPVFVNPNSYDSLKLVLRHIGKLAGVKRYGGTERVWVTVCCDGLPYTMLYRLTQEYLVCTICNNGFLGAQMFEEHQNQHPDVEHLHHIREFDWVMIHTGDGHYEMNLMKSFVELNWDVFMAVLAKRMGWTSEAALKAAKHCYDNHKTWQLILVFHFGSLLELLIPYIRKIQSAIDEDTEQAEKPTATGFLQFVKSMEGNPNYMYIFQMVSRYSQTILNFRMGIRRNNSLLIQSAKFMSKGLFHGRSHPRYQQIEMIETVQRDLMPIKLKDFINRHESMSRSDDSKGQGYDFILEEINKGIKSWMRRGVASDNMWLNVCRNYDQLLDIRSTITGMLSSDTAENSVRKLDLEDAITDWRVCLREKQYCIENIILHKSLSGEKLHEGLINFTKEAERKRDYRLMEIFLRQELPDDMTLRHPVFVTENEADKFQAFHNQTVQVIQKMTLDFIESLTDEEAKTTYRERFRKDIYRKNKSVLIEFFNEVVETLNETAQMTIENLDDTDL